MPDIDSIDGLHDAFGEQDYVADRALITSVFLALRLGRPLLLEGEAGVGKTELAKVLAAGPRHAAHPPAVLRRPRRQHRRLRVELPAPDARDRGSSRRRASSMTPAPATSSPRASCCAARCSRRSTRPMAWHRSSSLRSVAPTRSSRPSCSSCSPTSRSPSGDRHGARRTTAARHPHLEPHARSARRPEAALPHHWIDYPDAAREYEIVLARVPDTPERLATAIVAFVQRLRGTADQGAGRRRDNRLGGGAPCARGGTPDARAHR